MNSRVYSMPRIFGDIQYYTIDLQRFRKIRYCSRRKEKDNYRTLKYYFKRTIVRFIRSIVATLTYLVPNHS